MITNPKFVTPVAQQTQQFKEKKSACKRWCLRIDGKRNEKKMSLQVCNY